jgi:hypothetical protein
MSQTPMDDPVGFATALAMGLVGAALICLAASIAGGVLAAPVAWLESPNVQGVLIGVGVLCVGWEMRWFMNLAKRNNEQDPGSGD